MNLYLHGFTDPHVDEYDTLTSEEQLERDRRRDPRQPALHVAERRDHAAQPLSVQSKRSEVLFVDYIAEHLTPKGRAAIVVPEGIIFQSQSAYASCASAGGGQLPRRRDLAARGRVQPLLGRQDLDPDPRPGGGQARLSAIAFFKVENDGFGLGAQRRAVHGSRACLACMRNLLRG